MSAPFVLPTGIDRADGITILPLQPLGTGGTGSTLGTPTPVNAKVISSYIGSVQPIDEQPDSPEIERAEQGTIQHRMTMDWPTALQYIPLLGRGTFLQDSFGNITRILSSKIQHGKGDTCVLTVTAESISFDTPPDEFTMQSIDLGLSILKHPRYFYNMSPNYGNGGQSLGPPFPATADTLQEAQAKQAIIRAVQTYIDSPFFPTASNVAALLGATQDNVVHGITLKKFTYTIPNPNFNPTLPATAVPAVGVAPPPPVKAGDANPQYLAVAWNGTSSDSVNLALAAAQEMIQLLWQQEDTPYLAGIEITWSQYYFTPPPLSPLPYSLGSYIENAMAVVPEYFVNPTYSDPVNYNPNTRITDLVGFLNPQDYSFDGTSSGATNISWLRKADDIEYQRTWWKITRKWDGSPIGHWNNLLYGGEQRPTVPNDYLLMPQ